MTSWDTYYPGAERGKNLHNIAIEGMKDIRIIENQMPSWCRSRLYYSLYMPRWAGEFFGLLIFIALFFAALPFGLYMLLPQHKTWHLALVYTYEQA